MKILIFGASGFIGSHLSNKLSKIHNVTCVCRYSKISKKINKLDFFKNKSINTIYTDDLFNENFINNLLNNKYDIIFNCISYGVNIKDTNENLANQINVKLNLFLMNQAEIAGIKYFINFGSSQEYGVIEKGFSEKSSLKPTCVYGKSKAISSEKSIELSEKISMNYFILRIFSIFGPYEYDNKFFPLIIKALRYKKNIALTGGLQFRNYLYIDDFCKIIEKFISNIDLLKDRVYNINHDESNTLRFYADTISKTLDLDSNFLLWGKLKYRENEIFENYIPKSKLLETIKYNNFRSLSDGILKVNKHLL